MDYLVQYQDNVTAWDIRPWHQWPDITEDSTIKLDMSPHWYKAIHTLIMTLAFART